MILSILTLAVLGLIAFFHFTQGLFNSTVSAVCAGVAAVAAFGYHEPLVRAIGPETLGAYGDALCFAGLFALLYVVQRAILDNFLPSNVRYPVAFDKAGAAVMGLIAGFFAAGVVAVTAQMLPFGATAAGYSRYETGDGEIQASRRLSYTLYAVDQKANDPITISEVVLADRVGGEEAPRESLWVPVDRWFVGLVGGLVSQAGGSLASIGDVDYADAYPGGSDGYLDTLFGRRVGQQQAAKSIAVNAGDRKDVSLGDRGGLFLVSTGEGGQFPEGLPVAPGEEWQRIRQVAPGPYRPTGGKELLVVRLRFGSDAADEGGLVRFGPANARLVVAGGANEPARQYFPIGTIDSSQVLVRHAPDDRLLAQSGVDLAYEVDANALAGGETPEMPDGSFVEFKELARLPIGGERVYRYLTKDANTQVLRKEQIARTISEQLGATPPADNPELANAELWAQMRAALPQAAADPAAAEQAFAEGGNPEATAGAATIGDQAADPAAAATPPAAEEEEIPGTGGFIQNNIGNRAADRNEQIEDGAN